MKMTDMFKNEQVTKLLNEPDPIEEIVIKQEVPKEEVITDNASPVSGSEGKEEITN